MKISIITPSFNQGEFIQRTLDSVAEQRFYLPNDVTIEHVVFDGGSTDNTVAVLQAFTSPIHWVSEKDNGQTHAVNKGIQASDGEIIGWLNSDDIYYPGTLARILAFFNDNPTIDIVYGKADHIDVADQAFEDYPSEPWNFERLKETCIICQPALFFRRRVVEQHGLLDESLNYCMDYEYWLRLGKAGVQFAYLEEKLAGSRLYADNKTLGARVKVHREINNMFKKKFGVVSDRWLFNYAHVVVEQKINREEYPLRFMFKLLFSSLRAALRWNKKISFEMQSYLINWGRQHFLRKLFPSKCN